MKGLWECGAIQRTNERERRTAFDSSDHEEGAARAARQSHVAYLFDTVGREGEGGGEGEGRRGREGGHVAWPLSYAHGIKLDDVCRREKLHLRRYREVEYQSDVASRTKNRFAIIIRLLIPSIDAIYVLFSFLWSLGSILFRA